MALVQARSVAAAIEHHCGIPVEIVARSTEGDRWQGSLAALGGKGAFIRELDRAQLAGDVDITVHCLKDIPGDVPLADGLTIAAYLPRDDVHDAVVSRHGGGLDDLPPGATIGTSSVRRCAQIARHWPQLRPTPIRGNADTRLTKLDAGHYDAVVLAVSGLQRIGAADRITAVLPIDPMLPAIGAGVIVVVARSADQVACEHAGRLDDPTTRRAATAERSMLYTLAGHCHSPIAGLATTEDDGHLRLRGAVYSPDGATYLHASQWGDDPEALGIAVAENLIAKGARDLIDSITPTS
jgi:hydroxymethylbilane synthase